MTIVYNKELVQGSDEWLMARCGVLTASEIKFAISKKTDKKTGIVTYKSPDDDKSVAHLYELAAQHINQYVEPQYIGDAMLRGQEEESYARELYHEKYAPVETIGFITNDELGFTLGYSPDGLVGEDGQIECKSRKQKYQLETIDSDIVPEEYTIQLQTGLLVSGRKWCDFISYSGGMPMFVKRVYPDIEVQKAIKIAASAFNIKMQKIIAEYPQKIKNLYSTKRVPRDITI